MTLPGKIPISKRLTLNAKNFSCVVLDGRTLYTIFGTNGLFRPI